MSAIEVWRQRVAAHLAQSQKIKAAKGVTEEDRWEAVSPLFQANPYRTDDVEVNRLVREVTSSTTVLDVGAGAGRFALPLALRCQHVTVVEPSPSMRESLCQSAAAAGIANVSIVAKRWEEAAVEPAEVVLSAHVIYMIEDIHAFVMKLAAHARDKVLMPTFMRPLMTRYAPFWRCVHGEAMHELPGAAEFMPVLWDMDIYPDVEMFGPSSPRAFKDWQTALETLRRRTYVMPDTEEDARLQEAMQALLVETPNGYVMQDTNPARLALISWRPE